METKGVRIIISLIFGFRVISLSCICTFLTLRLSGCADFIEPSTIAQHQAFAQIVPPGPTIDFGKVIEAKVSLGSYRVVPGDVIELTIPAIFCVETTERLESPNGVTTLAYRVAEQGTISMPIIGDIAVAGMSLAEIESEVANTYYATVAKTRPVVFARILTYKTSRVSITGAVVHPGIYDLQHDKMSLVSLIMEAGGIAETGASVIRIIHTKEQFKSGPTSMRSIHTVNSYRNMPTRLTSLGRPGDYDQEDIPNLRMSFRPQGAGHTWGRLTVSLDGNVLVSDTLDLTNDAQRYDFLRRLVQKLPRLSIGTIEQRLIQLPSVMNGTIQTRVESGNHLYTNSSDNRHGYVRHQGQGSAGWTSYENHVSGTQRRLPRPREGVLAADAQLSQSERTIVLPVRGLNIPFTDVALEEGDRVIVEPLVMPVFTVIGLVNHQGNFEYPPGTSYNLMEAIAFAGGLDRTTDPRYAVIYRLRADGSIAHTYYDISKSSHEKDLPSAMSVIIRPGDIIDIAYTPRTRTKEFLDRIMRISIGMYIPLLSTDDALLR